MQRIGVGIAVMTALALCASADSFSITKYGDVKIKGYVGERLDRCIANDVAVTDGVYLSDVFKNKDETAQWQSEFWGKWMHSAVPFWSYTGNSALKANIDASVRNLLSTQFPDGYIGNYRLDLRCNKGWDIWGQKYTLLGLLHYYDGTGEKSALEAACKLADYLMANVGPNGRELYKTGEYRGMASCSVLEPVVWLYNRTKQRKYLDFATYIVSQMEDPKDGPKLIGRALAGVDVADRTSFPPGCWVWENGMKAYEMMSCYQGLAEYYEATGDKRCLDAVLATAKNIIATEINIVGGAAAGEFWYHGAKRQTMPFHATMETCVIVTWMRLCEKLLALTGDPLYADQLEKTFYNAFLGSLYRDGSVFSQYTALFGMRSRGLDQCRMQTNCCNANGPRGFLSFVRALLMADGDAAVINLYTTSRASIELPLKKKKVTFEIFTHYPKENLVTIFNRTEEPLDFTLKLRIPAWSTRTDVKVNGQDTKDVKPGTYVPVSRRWNPGDTVEIVLDMTCHAQTLNDNVAFTRGPIVLARDSRYRDGDIGDVVRFDEVIRPHDFSKPVPLTPVYGDNNDIWMSFVTVLGTGSHTESEEAGKLRPVRFCDFASAGGTWTDASSYRVWLPLVIDPAEWLCRPRRPVDGIFRE